MRGISFPVLAASLALASVAAARPGAPPPIASTGNAKPAPPPAGPLSGHLDVALLGQIAKEGPVAMTPGEETSFTYDQRYGVRAVSVEGKHADPTQLKVENVSEGDDLWLHLTEMRRATLTMSTHPITLVVHSETRGDVKIAIVPAPESNAPDAVEK